MCLKNETLFSQFYANSKLLTMKDKKIAGLSYVNVIFLITGIQCKQGHFNKSFF